MDSRNRSAIERLHFNNVAATYDTIRHYHSPSAKHVMDIIACHLRDTSARRRKSFVGSRSPGIARSRPCATKTCYETAKNGAPDGDLTIPLEQITAEGFPPSCTSGLTSDHMVLELGCGTGEITSRLTRLGLRVVAIDLSDQMLLQVQTKLSGGHARLITADVGAMPFHDSAFHTIVGNSILHHVDLESCLQECYRVLKPGGRAVFVEPNVRNPVLAIGYGIPLFRQKGWWGLSPTERLVHPRQLVSLATGIGFLDIDIRPLTFLHHTVPSLLLGLGSRIDRLLTRLPVLREAAYYTAIRLQR